MNGILAILIAPLVLAQHRSFDLPGGIEERHPARHLASFAEDECTLEVIRSMAEAPEPLKTNDVSINSSDQVVSVRLDYKNSEMIYGLARGLLKVKFEPTHRRDSRSIRASAYHDRLDLVGDYVMDGNISTIRISGKGRAGLTMLNVTTRHIVHSERYKKNDAQYLRVEKYEIELIPEMVHFRFDDLSSSSRVIRKPIGDILNENWKMFFATVAKEALEEKLASMFTDILNDICNHVPPSQFIGE